jgi:hypothetical protein
MVFSFYRMLGESREASVSEPLHILLLEILVTVSQWSIL